MEAQHDLPTLESAAMVGRWKARALKAIARAGSSPAGSFTRKHKAAVDEAAAEEAQQEETESGRSLVHGAMRFPGSRLRPAKWARVSHETSMADAMQLITRTWGLPAPSSLISIIGSSDGSERQQLFGHGLKRAAETTNAWILTDGAHEGIGGLVGPHVQPLPCLGVQSWPEVADHEQLKANRTTIMPRTMRRSAAVQQHAPAATILGAAAADALRQASFKAQPPSMPPSMPPSPPQHEHHQPTPPPSPPLPAAPRGFAPDAVQAFTSTSYNMGRRPSPPTRISGVAPDKADALSGRAQQVHIDSSHSHFILIDENWELARRLPHQPASTTSGEDSIRSGASFARLGHMKAPDGAGASEAGSLDSEPPSDPARNFRDALERHITSLEMSRDGYKVPSVTIVVNGDIETLRSVLERLQAGLPVVCLGDTGGAAADLFNYSLTAMLPPLGSAPDGRDSTYLLEASELIPMIVKEGAEQGGSTKPMLTFFLANYDIDGNDIGACMQPASAHLPPRANRRRASTRTHTRYHMKSRTRAA